MRPGVVGGGNGGDGNDDTRKMVDGTRVRVEGREGHEGGNRVPADLLGDSHSTRRDAIRRHGTHCLSQLGFCRTGTRRTRLWIHSALRWLCVHNGATGSGGHWAAVFVRSNSPASLASASAPALAPVFTLAHLDLFPVSAVVALCPALLTPLSSPVLLSRAGPAKYEDESGPLCRRFCF